MTASFWAVAQTVARIQIPRTLKLADRFNRLPILIENTILIAGPQRYCTGLARKEAVKIPCARTKLSREFARPFVTIQSRTFISRRSERMLAVRRAALLVLSKEIYAQLSMYDASAVRWCV